MFLQSAKLVIETENGDEFTLDFGDAALIAVEVRFHEGGATPMFQAQRFTVNIGGKFFFTNFEGTTYGSRTKIVSVSMPDECYGCDYMAGWHERD